MSQAGYTPIQLYYSATAAAAPNAGNLANGELALNITDGKLYYKDNGGVVRVLATTAGSAGDVVGPGSSTNSALVRFDTTTGKLVKNSVGVLSDAGVLTGLTGLTSSGNVTLSALTSGRVTYATTAGLLTDSANLAFDGATLTSAFAGPHNGTVGASTPNTGSFTTLSASSTVSGTGFSTYLASPPAIGGTAANTGSFTTLSASSTVTLNGGTANGVSYLNGSKILTTGSALTFDGANLGLGVTPSAWNIGKAIEVNNVGNALWGAAASEIDVSQNAYYNSGWKYAATSFASRYEQNTGAHKWWVAPSGTAGNAISFTQAMTLDASGNLLVNTSTPAQSNSTNNVLTLKSAGVAAAWGVGPTTSFGAFYISNVGTGVALSQGSTSWGTVSDERLKDIIEPIADAISKMLSLRSVIGKYKTDADGKRRSFLIAQDVQAVLPEAIDVGEDEERMLSVKYTEVIPLLVAAIHEQQAIITKLQADVAALRGSMTLPSVEGGKFTVTKGEDQITASKGA